MPEIGEVELMRLAIQEILNGRKFKRISVLGGRYLAYKIKDKNDQWIGKIKNETTGRMINIDPKKYKGGQSFVELDNLDFFNQSVNQFANPVINRLGKFVWIDLPWLIPCESKEMWYIAFTFGMSGAIYYEPTESVIADHSLASGKTISIDEYKKHFHLKFETDSDSGECFYFGDIRRMGTIIISNDRKKLQKKLKELGPDMLSDKPLTDSQFISILRSSKFCNQNICKVLMDQEAISGVGNYIKAECLYECCISPYALVSDIDDETLVKLHQSIRNIAQKAVEGHGASLYTYVGTRKEKGTFQTLLKVYGHTLDPHGNKVTTITDTLKENLPLLPADKRTIHYVKTLQTIGAHRDPNVTNPKPKIKLLLKQQHQ